MSNSRHIPLLGYAPCSHKEPFLALYPRRYYRRWRSGNIPAPNTKSLPTRRLFGYLDPDCSTNTTSVLHSDALCSPLLILDMIIRWHSYAQYVIWVAIIEYIFGISTVWMRVTSWSRLNMLDVLKMNFQTKVCSKLKSVYRATCSMPLTRDSNSAWIYAPVTIGAWIHK